jgi:hypothetical protein
LENSIQPYLSSGRFCECHQSQMAAFREEIHSKARQPTNNQPKHCVFVLFDLLIPRK